MERESAHKDSGSEMKRMHTGDVGGDECNKLCLLKQQSMQLSLITYVKEENRDTHYISTHAIIQLTVEQNSRS